MSLYSGSRIVHILAAAATTLLISCNWDWFHLYQNLPDDPGPAGEIGIGGIDTNDNGIRDEVERWIVLNSAERSAYSEDLLELARFSQSLLSAGGQQNKAAAEVAFNDFLYMANCLSDKMGNSESLGFLNTIEHLTVNTPERQEAFESLTAILAGRTIPYENYGSPSEESCKDSLANHASKEQLQPLSSGPDTVVLFLNGMQTSLSDSYLNMRTLHDRVRGSEILDDSQQNRIDFAVLYNPTEGFVADLLESAQQRFGADFRPRDSRIAATIYIHGVSWAINQFLLNSDTKTLRRIKDNLVWAKEEFLPAWAQVPHIHERDKQKIIDILRDHLARRENVILVTHSQGNLWAEEILEVISPRERERIQVVATAVPSNLLAGHPDPDNGTSDPSDDFYTTLFEDPVVTSWVPFSLAANVHADKAIRKPKCAEVVIRILADHLLNCEYLNQIGISLCPNPPEASECLAYHSFIDAYLFPPSDPSDEINSHDHIIGNILRALETSSPGCEPVCDGRQCGSDGCDGTCGECSSRTTCDEEEGVCIPKVSGKIVKLELHNNPQGEEACTIDQAGTLVCGGQLMSTDSYRDVAFAFGADRICAIRSVDQSIECWGGSGSPPAGRFKQITNGPNFFCALRQSDSRPICWTEVGSHLLASPNLAFRQIDCSSDRICGIRESDGSIACWNSNNSNTTVISTDAYFKVAASYLQACAIRSDNRSIECWGDEHNGLLSSIPSGSFDDVVMGSQEFACALERGSSRVQCWGINPVNYPSTYSVIAADGEFACGVNATTNLLFCSDHV